MEFLHCNGCGHLPQYAGQDPRRYFISSCGHIFCQNCVMHSKDNCAVCKVSCRLMEVNAQSKPDIKVYFMDPLTVLRDNLKQTTQVFNFQKSQQKSFQTIIGRLVETHKRAVAEIDHLKKGMEALKQEKQALIHKLETMEQEHQNWIGSGLANSISETAPFSMQTNVPSTPRNSFSSIFGDRNAGDSFNPRGMVTPSSKSTPFAINRNGDQPSNLFTPTPPSGNNHLNQSGSGVHYGPGRLTLPRTPTSENTPTSNRFGSPSFSAAPGSGRPNVGQTPDIVSRLRLLRCSASTPGSKPTPPPRSYMH